MYILLDGALVHNQLRTLPLFARPGALFEPLMPHPQQHLAGPLLISQNHVAQDNNARAHVQALLDGFGHRLHVAELASPLALPDLAVHLRRAVWFTDDSGESYGLRIADCRVMAYLPTILTPAQWHAITAPLTRWAIQDRQGNVKALPLDDKRQEHADTFQGIQLSAEQVERLMDEGEPDALLMQLGRPAGIVTNPRHHEDFSMAQACVRQWRAGGSADRAALLELARVTFSAGLASSRDPNWMSRAWQYVLARRR
ncbi:DUF4123 domain-containing protein [Pseudacidovorax intermedius]|uniref:DUF4123 domain-containing protein n=1 Tax=Pseudacidovorax intermedius TaxID=433924 RepID=UPI00069DEC76|nr:DUF4123 domain-containing protein [Pseudacidovorax intermedius]